MFQYVVTVALNYGEIKRNLERDSNIKPFINKCNWNGIDGWKTFEKKDPTIALNI